LLCQLGLLRCLLLGCLLLGCLVLGCLGCLLLSLMGQDLQMLLVALLLCLIS
jgi:hypothetical protein